MPTDKERITALETDNKNLKEDVSELKKGHEEWQKFCVRLVLKTGLGLLGIMTLGTFWGYLSPSAKTMIAEYLK